MGGKSAVTFMLGIEDEIGAYIVGGGIGLIHRNEDSLA